MPGPQFALCFVWILVVGTLLPDVSGEGFVGCLFSQRLCSEDVEWCYDDYAFGRCVPTASDLDEEDFYRYDLEKSDLHSLSTELRRLFALGYRWSHAYTQCRLQAMLFAIQNGLTFEHNTCSHLVDQDLEGALKALELEDPIDPDKVAIVEYTPSKEDPHADFADEVYYPPGLEEKLQNLQKVFVPQKGVDIYGIPDPYIDNNIEKRVRYPRNRFTSNAPAFAADNQFESPSTVLPSQYYDILRNLGDNNLYYARQLLKKRNLEPDMRELGYDFYPELEFLNGLSNENAQGMSMINNYDVLEKVLGNFAKNERQYDTDVIDLLTNSPSYNSYPEPKQFSAKYNTPNNFRNGWEARDYVTHDQELPETRVYINDDDDAKQEYGSGDLSQQELLFTQQHGSSINENPLQKDYDPAEGRGGRSGVYTEGGLIYVPESQILGDRYSSAEDKFKEELSELLEKYDMGFKRPERLDVKKPGPPFDTKIFEKASVDETGENDVKDAVVKKEPRGAHPNPRYDTSNVDTDYVHVVFKQSLTTWQEGNKLISELCKILNLEPKSVSHGRVDRNEVTFKVGPNSQHLNSTEVARKIEKIKEEFSNKTGMDIIGAGVGDKAKVRSVFKTQLNDDYQFYVIIFLLCGIIAALLVGLGILFIVRRHIASKEKLHGLTRPDSEASKDYQDLCRARMATKSQPTPDPIHGKVSALSKESEQSPSSRSSTSSWSEEPALHNMDISTGHMVLSYMEDHLKNKDRLEQEWVALWAYEAEPNATTIALKPENVQKNRYPDILPYDHSRVVLNELTNASGSDYINASSITDHDPRNPAYIATQGPLPNTSADFWQMIWEQGTVVIVILTRLTESGTAMCHRYWPEEGSELYHIYEVHLVSEHIWCDDYLVRSFYLKNTRTGETRTVTQFHFLSWPDGGIPSSTKALLEFRRKVNKSYRGRSCPIVVQCSDGSGRTGTYCLIDMVLSRMAKGAKEIDIAATLEHLRDQRPKMVATKQQFEFVLTAVAEEVHAILKALPPQPPAVAQVEREKT
ncbi:receptor-type tyrosine-protein phosphatase-like N [Agrilus planipennis]|uniref:Receptor-type tyrosine-protein phosphatase-like N n=1 Tax=Agrilus planipennis TaxID=224129 RepID=A0A1W4W4M4_AGRPL|nr:receptor-type tyrosine-protein phosphatase-like N [Agrilus planipennis]XP_018319084.1 receptor-type tyrosine-protein phosphatase-like N [Agrilus planipennis]XP_018319085.1 receptor-type tyrosine-protein phosphatase-like N [Agrilus planipennis]XP_018319086.1 receptor-type tyrosine-protein phosphatase-like N [Agrilus planipennis]